MSDERSYGIIATREQNGQRQWLLVQHHAGHWAFPKGHAEKSETAEETARREFTEETGLTAGDVDPDPIIERYTYQRDGQPIEKQVDYYLTEEVTGDARPQPEELAQLAWLDTDTARNRMTFDEGRKVLDEADARVDS
ncbi:MAG: NUDIX domain-containing protein [Phycisphaeraceae bacterium]|nr:NUDIX domain-containing protein [Phycisphaeraceae bacterium]